MPKIQALPTWLAINNANFTSPTGITDSATGQPIAAGGLNAGDYFDATNDEAATGSFVTNGILYNGRYRFVQVDSGATATFIKTGTVGYIAAGKTLKTAIVTVVGSGYTPGTYQLTANISSGGGTGASVQVVVGSNGALTLGPTVVLSGGVNYQTVPTFSMPASAGAGTGAVILGQLNSTPNVVTSYDQAVPVVSGVPVHPVVFLNAITPGNYGFVQELGTATVLGGAAIGAGNAPGGFCNVTTGGTVVTTVATGSPLGSTIGVAIDTPLQTQLFKIQLAYAATFVAD